MFADLLGVNFGTLADLKLPPQKISNIPSPPGSPEPEEDGSVA